ncbi:MAG TPA: baseplate J/gp47 family protein [Deinococcales bacterium]|nr:baseplate J/gp47 family protein [Deinococcales bacterium]
MPTLSDLLTAQDKDTLLAQLIANLNADGTWPATDWNVGSVGRTLLDVDATALADLSASVPLIAAGGYLDTATGAWLDLLAGSAYQLTRAPAVPAIGTLRLTCDPALGPYIVQANDLWATTTAGLRFTNTTGGALTPGGTLDLTVQAESPGATWNAPIGAVTTLVTPLPGVTCNNPAAIGGGTDAENDERLRQRCRLQWATLSGGATASAYQAWALAASPSVSKVLVRDQAPRGQGTADVVLWNDGGPIDAGTVNVANAYIQARRPVTADVSVYAATETIVTLTATVTVKAAYLTSAQAAIPALLATLRQQTPIAGTLYLAALVEALMTPAGVINAVITSPSGDTTLGTVNAVTINPNLTWVSV